jgi:ankyrin repeat protein
MALLTLPNEVFQQVITGLDIPKDFNVLARSSRSLYEIFNPWIYLDELTRDGGYSIIVYAAQMGHAGTIRRLFQFSTNNTTQEELKLDATGFSHGFTRSYIGKDGTYSYNGWSPLAWSAVRGDEDVMKLLLRIEGIDVDVKCPKGRTPLSFAAENGHVGIARLLLAAGANPNTRDDMLRTPLHWAGSPIPTGDPLGMTDPYWYFALNSKSKSRIYCPVKFYFEEDIAGSYEWDKGKTWGKHCTQCAEALDLDSAAPLTSISSSWSAGPEYKNILYLLIQYGANLELSDQKRRTPLCWAAACGYQLIVKLLLDNGARTHFSSKHQRTALSWAAENGHSAIVQTLIDRRDHGQSSDEPGTSPLSFAAMKGHYNTVQLLVGEVITRETWDQSSDWSPLVWAAVGGHARVVELLLAIHAKKWPKDPIGFMAVCWASCRGHTEIIQLLIAAGAEIACLPPVFDSMTPLQLATKNKHTDAVQYLLGTGKAEVNAVDRFGWTALTWTAGIRYVSQGNRSDARIKHMLLDHGADPSFERSRDEVIHPPHFIVRNYSDNILVGRTAWPISFHIDWSSLARGKRMRDVEHTKPILSLAMQKQFEGWSYSRPSSD